MTKLRLIWIAVGLMSLTACAEGSGPSLLGAMCHMREDACKKQCDAMRAEEALSCRRSCDADCARK